MNAMGLPKVQWSADSQQWYITDIGSDQPVLLDHWANQRPDLEVLDLQISAKNTVCHWVALPGVKSRMVQKAIPFALEDVMIDDIADYCILQPASLNGKHQAYAANQALIDSLVELLELHHLVVRSLTPESAALPEQHLLAYQGDGWLIKLQGIFEGWVPTDALMPVLESLINGDDQDLSLDQLTIFAGSRDIANITQTNLESSFPDVFQQIDISTEAPTPREYNAKASFVSPASTTDSTSKEARWWSGIAALAATWLILAVGGLFADNQVKAQKVQEVRAQSVSLYKQWFPGERIRILSRQFNEKLSGNDSPASGFMPILDNISRVYSAPDMAGKLTFNSIRYSDRLNEVTLEVSATALPVLQQLKSSLEVSGLTADIASATNDDGKVKGRIRIGASS